MGRKLDRSIPVTLILNFAFSKASVNREICGGENGQNPIWINWHGIYLTRLLGSRSRIIHRSRNSMRSSTSATRLALLLNCLAESLASESC